MLKRILLGILMMPMVALAQSYPSPTFNNLTVNGTFTATGKVGLGSLASQAANTVVANATGSSASPTAIAAPSCSTSSTALSWTSGTGLGCNTSINAATLGGATFAAPGAIGGTTPGAASFTTLSASGTVSGAGFSTYLASPPSIGSTAAGSGAFTTLSASSTVSGTGFSNYLASPPAIGGTTANSGKFTTIQATGTITPSTTGGIVGTTLADSSNSGSIGEYIFSDIPQGSAVTLTSNAASNVTSITLSAGDWEVGGSVSFVNGGSTTRTYLIGGISTTSATTPSPELRASVNTPSSVAATDDSYAIPMQRINVSASTTVYLVAQAGFSTSTCKAYGVIRARRVR